MSIINKTCIIDKRTIVFGDIHGCFDELQTLLDSINYDPVNDFLISCGDLVEKGPHSGKVVEFFEKTINSKVVKGNHEEAILRFSKHEEKRKQNSSYKNPMKVFDNRIDTYHQLSKSNLDFLEKLPWYFYFTVNEKEYCAIHAGVFPYTTPENMDPKILCRLRYVREDDNKKRYKLVKHGDERESDIFWTDLYKGQTFIFYGHQPMEEVRNKSNSMGLDLGAVFGNKLCAYIVEEGKLVSVPSKKYCDK